MQATVTYLIMSTKRNVIKSLHKLSPMLRSQFKDHYRGDYLSIARRISGVNGEIYTVVPFETDDTMYMVKIKLRNERRNSFQTDDSDDDDDVLDTVNIDDSEEDEI